MPMPNVKIPTISKITILLVMIIIDFMQQVNAYNVYYKNLAFLCNNLDLDDDNNDYNPANFTNASQPTPSPTPGPTCGGHHTPGSDHDSCNKLIPEFVCSERQNAFIAMCILVPLFALYIMKSRYDCKKKALDEKNNKILLFLEHDDKKQLNQPLNEGNTKSSSEKPKKSCFDSLLTALGCRNDTSQTAAANDQVAKAEKQDKRIDLNL